MLKIYQNMIYLLIHSLVPDISLSGKLEGIVKGKTRSGLLYECERIIKHCKPKYLLMENVKSLVGKRFKSQFDEWLSYLESLGYTNYWKVLNAKDYGVPQNRERIFVISILGYHKPYKFADKIPLDKCVADILEDEVDKKYYINKSFHLVGKGEGNKILEYKDKQITLPCICASRGRYLDNPSSGESGKPTEQRFEFNTRGISNTITTVQKDNYLVEQTYRIRKLTPRECFRLMGMRDDDIDKIQAAGISNTQQYKMAGNSIVVDVLEAIFKELFLD